MTDEQLAIAAREGDRRAFELLMQRHKEPLYRFVRRWAGNAHDAADLTQEAFLSAWLHLRRYDEQRPFLPWLRRIALNKCRDWSRRQMVRRAFLLRLEREPSAPSGDDQAERQHAALDAAIAGLPANLKEPLLLTGTLGLSHGEAGEMLGVSAKSIEMKIYRARARLREILPRGEGE